MYALTMIVPESLRGETWGMASLRSLLLLDAGGNAVSLGPGGFPVGTPQLLALTRSPSLHHDLGTASEQ